MLNEGVIVCEFASEAGEASSSDDVTNADEASRGNDALDADTSWLLCADVWVESEFDEWGCHAFQYGFLPPGRFIWSFNYWNVLRFCPIKKR